jgi:hypothetical protein
MGSRNVLERFWKIRHKPTGFYVVGAMNSWEWEYTKDRPSRFDTEVAKLGTAGKTYTTLRGALMMLGYLAARMGAMITLTNYNAQERELIFDTTRDTFELVEFHTAEVAIIER